MAGRPLKFQSVEELQNIPGGKYQFDDNQAIASTDFAKEFNLVEYITHNIQSFVKDFLEDELVMFEVDKPIHPRYKFSPRGRRVDLYIKGKNKSYIIETKNPKYLMENRQGIGQLLDYGREFLDPIKELLLITTKFDINTARTIKHYNLPIRYIFLSKNLTMEYAGDSNE